MTPTSIPEPTPGGRPASPGTASQFVDPSVVGSVGESQSMFQRIADAIVGTAGGAAVDCFSGPGGWDEGAAPLGIRPLGIEWDAAACETRRAAGHPTLEADVAEVDPADVLAAFGVAFLDLLIASPPCQSFSAAGTGEGRAYLSELAAVALAHLGFNSEEAEEAEALLTQADPRSLLVLEPARWIAACEPRNVALEQVPAVLPIWEAIAEGLRRLGYSAWTGILFAEQYGVPQTRKRAILIASLDREVGEPRPTHKRYVAPKKDHEDMDLLFGAETPERGRITHDSDHGLLEWVSMAEALGWGEGASPRPAPTITAGGGETGGIETFASKGARAAAAAAVDLSAGKLVGNNTIAGGPLAERKMSEPSMTVGTRADLWKFHGQATPTALDRRQSGGDGTPVPLVTVDRPAPTMTASGLASGRDVWVTERPATTVACDPRISPPGHHADGGEDGPRQMENAIRVTQAEAAVLQSFPAAYPWQGSKSKQFQQIGNAVPPLLAEAVLREVLGLPAQEGKR